MEKYSGRRRGLTESLAKKLKRRKMRRLRKKKTKSKHRQTKQPLDCCLHPLHLSLSALFFFQVLLATARLAIGPNGVRAARPAGSERPRESERSSSSPRGEER